LVTLFVIPPPRSFRRLASAPQKPLRDIASCGMILFLSEKVAHHEARSRRDLFGQLDRTSYLSDLNATGSGKHQRANPD